VFKNSTFKLCNLIHYKHNDMLAPNRNRLFTASCIALIVTSMTFAIRASILGDLGAKFELSDTQLGWINSMAFLGFPIAMLIGGPLCDIVGMGRLLVLAFIAHLVGLILTIFAGGFWGLFVSTFCIGFANGMVEAACNPLVTAMYTTEKTKMLNRFHMWFPGGLVIGGLVSYFMKDAGIGYKWQIATMLIPTLVYGFLFLGQKFPQTERVTSGISNASMLKAIGSPLYLIMIFAMFFSATTELGTNQWIAKIMENTTSNAVLLIVFISGIMAIGRYFAGPVEKKLSPTLMLLFSSVFAAIGLFWLSQAQGNTAFAAAGVFAIGVCYFWPTMIGFIAEYIPKSGALGMSLIGGAGMFATSVFNPVLGYFMDKNRAAALAQGLDQTTAELKAGQDSLSYVTIFPLLLVVIFTLLYVNRKKYEKNNTSTH
jgi:MFS family permease